MNTLLTLGATSKNQSRLGFDCCRSRVGERRLMDEVVTLVWEEVFILLEGNTRAFTNERHQMK
jgi:hypothetical protein